MTWPHLVKNIIKSSKIKKIEFTTVKCNGSTDGTFLLFQLLTNLFSSDIEGAYQGMNLAWYLI